MKLGQRLSLKMGLGEDGGWRALCSEVPSTAKRFRLTSLVVLSLAQACAPAANSPPALSSATQSTPVSAIAGAQTRPSVVAKQTPASSAPAEDSTADSVAAESLVPAAGPARTRSQIPRECASSGGKRPEGNVVAASAAEDGSKDAVACFPPSDFVERLCAANYSGVALVMFHPASPWKRGYLKGETKAWTAAPGAQKEERLKFNEEVLVLQSNNGADGALAGQGDSFYALRWNGSCVKLTEEELNPQAPWRKLASPVQWGWLDDNVQSALLEDAKVAAALGKWRKQCRKAAAGEARCTQLEAQLTDAIVAYVRSAAALPEPEHRP